MVSSDLHALSGLAVLARLFRFREGRQSADLAVSPGAIPIRRRLADRLQELVGLIDGLSDPDSPQFQALAASEPDLAAIKALQDGIGAAWMRVSAELHEPEVRCALTAQERAQLVFPVHGFDWDILRDYSRRLRRFIREAEAAGSGAQARAG